MGPELAGLSRARPACGRLEPEASCLRPHQGRPGLCCPRRMLVASCLLQPAGRPSQQGRPLGPTHSQNRGQLEAQSRAGLPEALLSGAWTSCLMPLLRTVLLPAAPSRGAVALDRVTDLGGGPGRLPRAPLWSVRSSSGFREEAQLRAANVRAAGHLCTSPGASSQRSLAEQGTPSSGPQDSPAPRLALPLRLHGQAPRGGRAGAVCVQPGCGSWERAGLWVAPGKPGSSQDGEPLSAERGSPCGASRRRLCSFPRDESGSCAPAPWAYLHGSDFIAARKDASPHQLTASAAQVDTWSFVAASPLSVRGEARRRQVEPAAPAAQHDPGRQAQMSGSGACPRVPSPGAPGLECGRLQGRCLPTPFWQTRSLLVAPPAGRAGQLLRASG